MNRDQGYYAKVAEACDELISHTTNSVENPRVILGDDKSLVPILRDLNATRIEVSSQGIWIQVGNTKVGFGIVWEPSDYDDKNAPWELRTSREDIRKVVYSIKKAALSKDRPDAK